MENAITVNLNDYLSQKEMEIKNSLIATVYNVGKILKDVKEKLEGTETNFIEWVVKIGISPQCARNYIKYYEINEQNCGELQKLPIQLVIEYGKEDTTPELKDKVLKGEVKTAKLLKELKKELQEIKPEYSVLKGESEKWKAEKKKLYTELDSYVERTSSLEQKLEQSGKRNESEIDCLFIDIFAFINEKIPKAKFYLSKTNTEYQREKVDSVILETTKILESLR